MEASDTTIRQLLKLNKKVVIDHIVTTSYTDPGKINHSVCSNTIIYILADVPISCTSYLPLYNLYQEIETTELKYIMVTHFFAPSSYILGSPIPHKKHSSLSEWLSPSCGYGIWVYDQPPPPPPPALAPILLELWSFFPTTFIQVIFLYFLPTIVVSRFLYPLSEILLVIYVGRFLSKNDKHLRFVICCFDLG